MTEPEQPPEEPGPEQPTLPPETVPEVPMGEPPAPTAPEQTDVRTMDLLDRRRRRMVEADEAAEALAVHEGRSMAVRKLIAADMGPELTARYEDLARVSDAMARAAKRVWKYHQDRVHDIDTELGQPPTP